jgi:hypothetical protein
MCVLGFDQTKKKVILITPKWKRSDFAYAKKVILIKPR